jgi:conjugative relaxase-like TrwC/TraI family protein
MFVCHKIGDEEYYIKSQENLTGDKLTFADYLVKNNEREPEFIGKLAAQYALNNKDFDKKDFNKIYNGFKPNGQKAIRSAGSEDHQAGQEMCLTLPKSLSVLFATAPEELRTQLMQIIHDSSDEVMKNVEQLLMPSNQRSEYRNNLVHDKTEMVASKFTHYENRNLDPHIHVHVQVFNQALFHYSNGKKKTMAVDYKKLLAHQKELSEQVNFLIICKLKDLGINIIPDEINSHSFKVEGVPHDVCVNLSERSQEIAEWAKSNKLKFSSTAERDTAYQHEQIRKVTAKDKQELSYNEIMQVFEDKLTANNFDYEKFKINNKVPRPKYIQQNDFNEKLLNKEFIKMFEDELVSKSGNFTRTQFNTLILNHFKHDVRVDKLEDIQKLTEVCFKTYQSKLNVIEYETNKFTTINVIKNEHNVVKLAKELSEIERKLPPGKFTNTYKAMTEALGKSNLSFNSGQKEAIGLLSKGKAIVSITGDAGTGKTSTVIKFANELHKDTNHVYGLATAGITATALKEADIKNTKNIAEFINLYESGKIIFDKPPTLIVDEASMVSAVHMNKLLEITTKHDGNIIMVGDTKQLSSVDYGSALQNINNNISTDNQARLDENMRQKNELAKSIAECFRDKKVDEAMELLKSNNLFHTESTQDKIMNKLVGDYFTDTKDLSQKTVITQDNSNVNKLNDKIRTRLLNDNKLDFDKQVLIEVKKGNKKEITEGRYFVENDRIVIKSKTKIDKNTVLENGTVATIKSINPDTKVMTLLVVRDNVETIVNLDTNKHNNFNHAYCQTAYKSQGQTVSNTYVFSTGSTTANQAYVEFSRHKDSVNLYMVNGAEDKFVGNAKVSQTKFNAIENEVCLVAYSQLDNKIEIAPEQVVEEKESIKFITYADSVAIRERFNNPDPLVQEFMKKMELERLLQEIKTDIKVDELPEIEPVMIEPVVIQAEQAKVLTKVKKHVIKLVK